jgi:hypothetical protein
MTEGLVLLRHHADLTISLLRGHSRQQAGLHGTFAGRQAHRGGIPTNRRQWRRRFRSGEVGVCDGPVP